MSKVAVVRAMQRDVGIRQALDLLEDAAVPFAGRKVVLKPNFNSDDRFPGSTHNDTLRVLVAWLCEVGATGITLAERSGGSWMTHEVFEKKGIPALAKELGIEAVETDALPADDWVAVPLKGSHWSRGVEVPRPFLAAETILQTCCLKTHAYGGHFTLSLKNGLGVIAKRSPRDGYDYMGEMHRSSHIREMIAEANLVYTPDLVVVDGMEAFVRGGPAMGTRVSSRVILASSDRVAVDAVGVAILRLYVTTREVARGAIFDLAQIKRAAELGLGASSAEAIELVAAQDPESRSLVERLRTKLFG